MFKGDIDLFNHVIGKRMLRIVVLRGRFSMTFSFLW